MSEAHSRPTNSADSAALVGVGGRNKSDEKKNETSLRSLEDDVANRMGQGVEGRAAARRAICRPRPHGVLPMLHVTESLIIIKKIGREPRTFHIPCLRSLLRVAGKKPENVTKRCHRPNDTSEGHPNRMLEKEISKNDIGKKQKKEKKNEEEHGIYVPVKTENSIFIRGPSPS